MILLALGANLPSRFGTPLQTLSGVLAVLPEFGVRVLRASRFFSNPAVPASNQPDYVNCVVEVATDSSPQALLDACLEIERQLGRVRGEKWGPRSVDIDIVDFEGQMMVTDELTLPHPRLAERAFVLVPLLDLDPEWEHPILGRTAKDLAESLDPAARASVLPLAPQQDRT